VALVFPGEGSQYANMLGQLCRHFPAVRREFDLTSRAFEARGASLARVLFPQPATAKQVESELFEMDTAVAAVTAAARGLWRLLGQLRVQADAVVGHSSGEYAALLAAGAYRHQDDDAMVHAILAGIDSAVELKTANILPQCTLVSVGGVPEATLDEVLAEFRGEVTVAMDNCPHQKILVGGKDVMSQVLLRLQGQGGLCQPLAWDRPYHTEAFAPACSIVQRYFDSLELCPPEIELWSCATAAPMPRQSDAVRELAVRQWRSPVRFRETINAMYAAGVRVFIECGPRGNLSTFVADTLGDRPHAAVPLDVPNKSGLEQLCRAMGALAAHGVALDLSALFARRSPQELDFDGPPFQAPPPEPMLPLELPMLEMAPEVVDQWRASAPVRETKPHAASHGNGQHNSTNGKSQPGGAAELSSRSNGPAITAPQRSSARPALAESVSRPTSVAAAPSLVGTIHEEFQRTMQQFLRVQATVGALWGAPARAPASDFAPTDAVAPEDSPMLFHRNATPPAAAHAGSAPSASTFSPAAGASTLDRPDHSLAQTAPRHWPFVESLLELRPGLRVMFECELAPEKHPFLRDHTFFGRRVSDAHPNLTPLAVMPLAMSMELLAEAAATLCPEQSVVGLSDIRMSRWLAFAGDSRRVRVIAHCVSDQWVEARLVEADGDGEHEILAAQVELGNLPNTLGPRRLPQLKFGPPPWPREALYQRILYHGPSFQGIEHVEAWGPSGVSAQVREPGQRLLAEPDADLVLPVALIDTASQIPGLVNGDLDSAGACCTMAFPNVIERLEFGRAIFDGQSLAAVSTLEQLPGKLRSDTEFARPDGQVVLRYWNKVEETVEFPLPLYRYALNPHTAFRERSLNGLFAGVPLVEKLAICQATAAGERLWAKAMWARVLAYQIFGAAERAEFNRLKLPPVALADWLLGRLAAKEAVRARLAHGGCLADTEIRKDQFERPRAFIAGREVALVSLAHKTFQAVAVCGLAADFQGLGIDCEPLDALPPEVLADAFDDRERQLLDFAHGPRAGWGAKEAVGKALGRGVLGGPRSLAIESADPQLQTITISLRGAMAQAFPQYRQGEPVSLTAHWREHDQQIIVLSFLPNS
jgi:malonyl CoA-acyl carrier protein transacylase/4'-phosphopantetheinyl transferase EntD